MAASLRPTTPAPAHAVRTTDLRGTGSPDYGAVLADPSGRRASWLRRVGRVVALVFLLWLFGLVLAGLGLLPLSDLPLAGALRSAPEPSPLSALPRPRPTATADLRPAVTAAQAARASVADGVPVPSASTPRGLDRTAPADRPHLPRPVAKPRPKPGNFLVPSKQDPTPGQSQAAPGQTQTQTRPGRSGAAPGHAGTDAPATTTPSADPAPSTGAGNSDAAPGHDPTRTTGHGPPSR
ncbi:MAG: hypothetical protein JWM73_2797 [Solirubrobacterales bacterium]|nr:hypothetical protein [Solirubrobacterales bacterium]